MFIVRLIAALSLVLASTAAMAQSYPNRVIRIIVPYSAGAGGDVMARTLGKVVSERIGQPIVIENRDGGGSLIGTMAVAKAVPDGYTILQQANPFVIVPSQHLSPPYDPLKEFVPIAKVGVIPLVLAAAPGVPFKSIKELVAYARANPGKLSYASSGAGTISQQEMEVFKQAAGLDIVEVGYKSTAQAMTDTLGAHIPLFPVVIPLVMQHIKAGKVTALGLFDTQRSPAFPEIPLAAEELGVPGYTPTPVWYGFFAPAGTPAEIVNLLNGHFQGAVHTAEVGERLQAMGATPLTPTNAQFSADLAAEYEKAGKLARMLGTAK